MYGSVYYAEVGYAETDAGIFIPIRPTAEGDAIILGINPGPITLDILSSITLK